MSAARPSPPPPTVVVFTDLDGTLLDYDGYTWTPATGALKRLREQGVEIVFCSSKTLAEQRAHQGEIGLRSPMVVENGSAVAVPHHYFPGTLTAVESGKLRRTEEYDLVAFGVSRASVSTTLDEVRRETGLRFRCYSDMTPAEVGELTGLPESAARRARLRDFSETVVVEGGAEAWMRFLRALSERGLRAFGDGPSGTVVGGRADKGVAVGLLRGLYRRWSARFGLPHTLPLTVGVGDGPNDASMLRVVDRAFLVERRGGGWEDLNVDELERVPGIGPEGWARAIERILEEEGP